MVLFSLRALAGVSLFSIYLLTLVSANLPSYPLAVRSPYLSAWVPGDQSNNFPIAKAQFWQGQPLHWTILARVDSKTFSLFGVPEVIPNCPLASQSSIKYTSTHTQSSILRLAPSILFWTSSRRCRQEIISVSPYRLAISQSRLQARMAWHTTFKS